MQPVVAPPWFICDAVNAPVVLVVSQADAGRRVTILSIDKDDLRPPSAAIYDIGPEDPGAGGVTRALSRDGAEAGYVRSMNPAMLDDPAAATTPPVTSVKLDERTLTCRWVENTRLFGVVAGRTVLVTQGENGPNYRSFDFKRAGDAASYQPDGVQRSTSPSLLMREGKVDGDSFTFTQAGYGYLVTPRGVSVTQGGAATVDEPFIAVVRAQKP